MHNTTGKTKMPTNDSIEVVYEVTGYVPPPIPDDCVRVVFTPKYRGWKAKREDVEAWLASKFGLPARPMNTFRNPVVEGPHFYVKYRTGTDLQGLQREVGTNQHILTRDGPVTCRVEFVGQTLSRVSVEGVPYELDLHIFMTAMKDLCGGQEVNVVNLPEHRSDEMVLLLPLREEDVPDFFTIKFKKDNKHETAHIVFKMSGRRMPCRKCGLRSHVAGDCQADFAAGGTGPVATQTKNLPNTHAYDQYGLVWDGRVIRDGRPEPAAQAPPNAANSNSNIQAPASVAGVQTSRAPPVSAPGSYAAVASMPPPPPPIPSHSGGIPASSTTAVPSSFAASRSTPAGPGGRPFLLPNPTPTQKTLAITSTTNTGSRPRSSASRAQAAPATGAASIETSNPFGSLLVEDSADVLSEDSDSGGEEEDQTVKKKRESKDRRTRRGLARRDSIGADDNHARRRREEVNAEYADPRLRSQSLDRAGPAATHPGIQALKQSVEAKLKKQRTRATPKPGAQTRKGYTGEGEQLFGVFPLPKTPPKRRNNSNQILALDECQFLQTPTTNNTPKPSSATTGPPSSASTPATSPRITPSNNHTPVTSLTSNTDTFHTPPITTPSRHNTVITATDISIESNSQHYHEQDSFQGDGVVFSDDLHLNTDRMEQEDDMEEFDSDDDLHILDAAGSSQGHPIHPSNLTQRDSTTTHSPGLKRTRDSSGKKSVAKLAKKLFDEHK